MGTCTYLSTDSSNSQNALAGLNKWTLERDDSEKEFPHRVYRDKENNIYHSVTHILKETSPQVQKDALKNWLSKPSSPMERDVACERGKLTHSNAEYILKLAGQLSRKTANAKGVWRSSEDGLFRCPPKITQWAIQQATESAPKVKWSASGYARSLRPFILERVTAVHAVEFSVLHPSGFAGTCDALLDIKDPETGYSKGSYIVDWKTSKEARSEEMITNYMHQCGAYSLGLKHLTNIKPIGAIVCIARRVGKPQVRIMNEMELLGSEIKFMERCDRFINSFKKKSPDVL
tara:strand:- start:1136 stop:2005 length:870 start_codon:yes stop_codon:yes gene_type:complete